LFFHVTVELAPAEKRDDERDGSEPAVEVVKHRGSSSRPIP
jgi:hypothetical protein